MLAVVTRRARVPLIWSVLDNKGGSSDIGQRIVLMQRYLAIFGAESVRLLGICPSQPPNWTAIEPSEAWSAIPRGGSGRLTGTPLPYMRVATLWWISFAQCLKPSVAGGGRCGRCPRRPCIPTPPRIWPAAGVLDRVLAADFDGRARVEFIPEGFASR